MLRADISPIENLPNELLGEIAQLLGFPSFFLLSSVSKKWNKLFSSDDTRQLAVHYKNYFTQHGNAISQGLKTNLQSLTPTISKLALYGKKEQKEKFKTLMQGVSIFTPNEKDLKEHKTLEAFFKDEAAIKSYLTTLANSITENYGVSDIAAVSQLYQLIQPFLAEPEHFAKLLRINENTLGSLPLKELKNNKTANAYDFANIILFLQNLLQENTSEESEVKNILPLNSSDALSRAYFGKCNSAYCCSSCLIFLMCTALLGIGFIGVILLSSVLGKDLFNVVKDLNGMLGMMFGVPALLAFTMLLYCYAHAGCVKSRVNNSIEGITQFRQGLFQLQQEKEQTSTFNEVVIDRDKEKTSTSLIIDDEANQKDGTVTQEPYFSSFFHPKTLMKETKQSTTEANVTNTANEKTALLRPKPNNN